MATPTTPRCPGSDADSFAGSVGQHRARGKAPGPWGVLAALAAGAGFGTVLATRGVAPGAESSARAAMNAPVSAAGTEDVEFTIGDQTTSDRSAPFMITARAREADASTQGVRFWLEPCGIDNLRFRTGDAMNLPNTTPAGNDGNAGGNPQSYLPLMISHGWSAATGRRPVIITAQIRAVAQGSDIALITDTLLPGGPKSETITLAVFSFGDGKNYTANLERMDASGAVVARSDPVKPGYMVDFSTKTNSFGPVTPLPDLSRPPAPARPTTPASARLAALYSARQRLQEMRARPASTPAPTNPDSRR